MIFPRVFYVTLHSLHTEGLQRCELYNVISCLRWQRVGFFREGSVSLMLSSLKEDTQEYYYTSEGISYQ